MCRHFAGGARLRKKNPVSRRTTTNISSECGAASIGPDHPKPDGIFGNDRLQLKRLSYSFLDLLVLERSWLVYHRYSTEPGANVRITINRNVSAPVRTPPGSSGRHQNRKLDHERDRPKKCA